MEMIDERKGTRTDRGVRLRRLFWYGGGLILAVAALVANGAVIQGDFSDTDGRILGTLGAMFLAGSAALAGLGLVERGAAVALGWAAAASSPAWFGMLAAVIWTDSPSDTLGRAAGTAALLLAGGLFATTNRLLVRDPRALALFAATSAALAVAMSITLGAIWSEDPGDSWAKALAVFWILTALGYFLTPIAQRFLRAAPEPAARVIARLDGVELTATSEAGEGDIVVSAANGRLTVRLPQGEVELAEGELLAVREL